MEVKIVTTPFVVGDPVWQVDLGGVKDYTVYPGRVGAVVLSMGKEQIWSKRFGVKLKGDNKLTYFAPEDIGVSWFDNREDAEAEAERRNG